MLRIIDSAYGIECSFTDRDQIQFADSVAVAVSSMERGWFFVVTIFFRHCTSMFRKYLFAADSWRKRSRMPLVDLYLGLSTCYANLFQTWQSQREA
jgi:hypothetical protein